ncbi:hypothetical protein KJ059_05415 [Myxococcota bacterium]|nr:hypothetical protein [Myxococcota bacterium]MCZ7619982.1 hypothetical protein [Myxococcota bacterium]
MHRSTVVYLLLVLGLALGNEARAEPPDFAVEIEPGLTSRMTPNDVAQVVLSRLAEPQVVVPGAAGVPELVPPAPRILSMKLRSGNPWKTRMVRDDGSVEEIGSDVVWVVHAKGSFVSRRSWPGKGPIVRSSGFYVLDDETGQIIARGTLPPPEPDGD